MAAKKIIFITGGNTGLGYETVKALCQSSKAYEIIVGSRSVQKGNDAISTLKAEVAATSSTLSTMQVDIESDESITKAFEETKSKYGKVDVLINNAGGTFDVELAEGRLGMREAWNKSWNLNVTSTQIMTHTFVPLLLNSADPRLLFITSGTSALKETEDPNNRLNAAPSKGWPKTLASPLSGIATYRSAKTGMNMMMREWCKTLREDGVKVLCVSPGFLATGLGSNPELLKKMGALDPSIGGNFVKDVVEGKRDADAGFVMRKDMIQPW